MAVPVGIEPTSSVSETEVIPLYQGTMAEEVGLEPTIDRASKAPAIAAMRLLN